MAMLDPADGHAVLISAFEMEPERAQGLAALVERATREVMRRMDGVVSASIHVSEDRLRVVNDAQWRDRAAFDAVRRNPESGPHMAEAAGLATSFDKVIYERRFSEGPA